MVKILTVSRKSHRPIETLLLFACIFIGLGLVGQEEGFSQVIDLIRQSE